MTKSNKIYMIIEEKEKKIIKTNHFITIYLMVNGNIKKKNISASKRIRILNCSEYLVI